MIKQIRKIYSLELKEYGLFSNQVRNEALARYSPDIHGKRLFDLYNKVINDK